MTEFMLNQGEKLRRFEGSGGREQVVDASDPVDSGHPSYSHLTSRPLGSTPWCTKRIYKRQTTWRSRDEKSPLADDLVASRGTSRFSIGYTALVP